MGFDDRDYSQEPAWGSAGQADNPITKWTVILAVVVFVMQLFTVDPQTDGSVLYELISMKAPAVMRGQVWRLLTFALCNHPRDIINLVFSLLIIWQFGTQLERMYGSRELLFFNLASMLTVSLVFTAWGLAFPLRAPITGSFPLALALLTLYATHFPRTEVYILPLISIELRWLVALYALFGLYPALFQLQTGGGAAALAYTSPLMGIVFALAYRHFDLHLSAVTANLNPGAWKRAWRRRAAQRTLKVYAPAPEENLDTKVDAILAKIHDQGSESLTDAERAVLVRASERAKNRI